MSRLTEDKHTTALVNAGIASALLSDADEALVLELINMAYGAAWKRAEDATHEAYRVAIGALK